MKFNNEVYKQIKGTAMGTIFAPNLRNFIDGIF